MKNILKRIKRKFSRKGSRSKETFVIDPAKLRQAPVINEVPYSWAQSLSYNFTPSAIVYHHTVDSNLTPEQINEIHKQRGWAGIGYHFYIRKDGTIYRGRPENAVGSHAPTMNSRGFGIALEGNFNEEFLTPQQLESVIQLSRYLMDKYNFTQLLQHKDVRATECPGANFPFAEIKSRLGVG